LYLHLLEERGLQRDEQVKINPKKPPQWVVSLAQTLYMAYSEELLIAIRHDEEEFREVFNELEVLKSKSE
jgi:hypothetical protein